MSRCFARCFWYWNGTWKKQIYNKSINPFLCPPVPELWVTSKAKLKVCLCFLEKCLNHLDCLPVFSVCLSQTCFPFCAPLTAWGTDHFDKPECHTQDVMKKFMNGKQSKKKKKSFTISPFMDLFVLSPLAATIVPPWLCLHWKTTAWVTSQGCLLRSENRHPLFWKLACLRSNAPLSAHFSIRENVCCPTLARHCFFHDFILRWVWGFPRCFLTTVWVTVKMFCRSED